MKLRLWEITLFPLLGALMYVLKLVMELLPNIHLLAMLTVVFTVVFRAKALIPVYIFVFLTGLFGGFSTWWVPHLYLWTVLWGVVMLLPKNMPTAVSAVVYSAVCGLHGLLYGTMYAPFQALAFGLDFDGMVAWIISGLPFDLVHCAGNLLTSLLILPLCIPLKKVIAKFT